MTTETESVELIGYDKVSVNTAELAESLSNEWKSLKTADFGFETK